MIGQDKEQTEANWEMNVIAKVKKETVKCPIHASWYLRITHYTVYVVRILQVSLSLCDDTFKPLKWKSLLSMVLRCSQSFRVLSSGHCRCPLISESTHHCLSSETVMSLQSESRWNEKLLIVCRRFSTVCSVLRNQVTARQRAALLLTIPAGWRQAAGQTETDFRDKEPWRAPWDQRFYYSFRLLHFFIALFSVKEALFCLL